MKILKVVFALILASAICFCAVDTYFAAQEEQTEIKKEPQIKEKSRDFSGFATGKAVFDDAVVSAKSALLCTADGMLVYEKNADTPLPMASITKVMTVILALEMIDDLQKTVTVPNEAVGVEGSSVYLQKGESVTLEMLVYSAMLESANDATTALAIVTGGSLDAFVSKMNEKAKSLSMMSTHFCNPHGLHESEHFTTARDYVKLMSYALENETFCKIISTKKMLFAKQDGSATRVLTNHNRLLNTYSGMLGGKTGYTKTSGRTLITAAQKNGTTLICITLDASGDWVDHTVLFNRGFDAVETVTFEKGDIKTEIEVAGGQTSLTLINGEKISFSVLKGESVTVDTNTPHINFAPINEGDEVGTAVFYKNGKKIGEIPLVAEHPVYAQAEEKSKGFFARLLDKSE